MRWSGGTGTTVDPVTDRLDVTRFAPAVDTTFTARAGDLAVSLRLVSATTRGAGGDDPESWTPFNLVFLGPVDPVLPQMTYRLEHPTVGDHDVFLVPVGRDGDGTHYEAVFG